MTKEKILQRLQRPQGRVKVVLDTDAYNEVDDQYAIAYALQSPDKLDIQAIYAAPFCNNKAASADEGMCKSYDEILNVLSLMGRGALSSLVYHGSSSFLKDEVTPVHSDAANDLISRALAQPEDEPLYVISIGALSNVASALLIRPEIVDKIVLIWLGGHSFDWHNTKEFNLLQDIAAARVVFDSKVPLVLLPCMGVVSGLRTSEPELSRWIKGKNKLCDYLYTITCETALQRGAGFCWSKVIWDVAAVAWLINEDFMLERIESCPLPSYEGMYTFDSTRHSIKYVYYIHRDDVFEDLFTKLALE